MFTAKLRGLGDKNPLANDALAIWSAATRAVLPQQVIPGSLDVSDEGISIAGRFFAADTFTKFYVFGAGKAGAAMAVEVERALRHSRYWETLRGQVNVPENAGGLPATGKITLSACRPPGYNFPTPAAESATYRMMDELATLDSATIALGLISGGGSALLVNPRDGVQLEHLSAVAQFLQAAGATIHELNAVRGWLCQTKAGGLAQRCSAGRIETLIISDVVGDDLSVIASGPCFASSVSAAQAASILQRFVAASAAPVDRTVLKALAIVADLGRANATHNPVGDHVRNNLIATNQAALAAATQQAKTLGYEVVSLGSTNQGDAYEGGRRFAVQCDELRQRGGRWCIISGGEPTVVLSPNRSGICRGGRNQAWALAALDELSKVRGLDLQGMAILSGGTDGEDGPCDVAGAIITQEILQIAHENCLDPAAYLDDNNEYAFFDQASGHLDTGGGTNTNVCDIRIACVAA